LDSFAAGAREKTLGRLIDTKRLALVAREQKLDERPDVKRQIENLVDELLAAALVAETAAAAPQTDEAAAQILRSPSRRIPNRWSRSRATHRREDAGRRGVAAGKAQTSDRFCRARAPEYNTDSTKEAGASWVGGAAA